MAKLSAVKRKYIFLLSVSCFVLGLMAGISIYHLVYPLFNRPVHSVVAEYLGQTLTGEAGFEAENGLNLMVSPEMANEMKIRLGHAIRPGWIAELLYREVQTPINKECGNLVTSYQVQSWKPIEPTAIIRPKP